MGRGRTQKALDLSFLGDVRLRTWLLQLAKNVETRGGDATTIPPPTSGGGSVTIIRNGLQFTNDVVYGALLQQGMGWSQNRISFQPNVSIVPLVIDVAATKRAAPFVVLSQPHGYVMTDAQAVPHYWQFRMSPKGIPFVEDLGATSANATLSLA